MEDVKPSTLPSSATDGKNVYLGIDYLKRNIEDIFYTLEHEELHITLSKVIENSKLLDNSLVWQTIKQFRIEHMIQNNESDALISRWLEPLRRYFLTKEDKTIY